MELRVATKRVVRSKYEKNFLFLVGYHIIMKFLKMSTKYNQEELISNGNV